MWIHLTLTDGRPIVVQTKHIQAIYRWKPPNEQVDRTILQLLGSDENSLHVVESPDTILELIPAEA